MPQDADVKKDVISKYRLHESDTGSSEVQVALLSQRIEYLTEHLRPTRRITIRVAGYSSSWGNGAAFSTT